MHWLKNEWGTDKFEFKFIHAADDTQCFVIADNKAIVVSFRGTESVEDWMTNLNFDLVDGPLDGRVHEGFWTSLSSVWQQVEMTISRFRAGGSKSIWITGHSLGAALATLGAAKRKDDDHRIDGLGGCRELLGERWHSEQEAGAAPSGEGLERASDTAQAKDLQGRSPYDEQRLTRGHQVSLSPVQR